MEYLCYSKKSDFPFKNVKIPLSYFYKILKELSILASTYVAISRSDRDSIIEAKRIIDSQVAILAGYSKASNFAAAFKRKYGVNPKNYKAEAKIG